MQGLRSSKGNFFRVPDFDDKDYWNTMTTEHSKGLRV
jgi:hypothetical protein